MCNLYSLTKGQAAIIALTRAMRDTTGNLPIFPGIFLAREELLPMSGAAHRIGSTEGSRNGNYRHGRRTAEATAQGREVMSFIREARAWQMMRPAIDPPPGSR